MAGERRVLDRLMSVLDGVLVHSELCGSEGATGPHPSSLVLDLPEALAAYLLETALDVLGEIDHRRGRE